MKTKRILPMTVALVAAVNILSGCSDTETTSLNRVDASDLATASKPDIPPIIFGESDNIKTSDPISEGESVSNSDAESLSEDNSTTDTVSSHSTEIEVSSSGDYYFTTAKTMEYDPEKVKSVIFGDSAVTDNTLNYPDRSPIYMWEHDGKEVYLSNDDAALEYTSDLSTSINIIFGAPTQSDKGNADQFEHIGDDLDFCTREEAVKSVKNTLSELGISVSDKAAVYSLFQNDMQSVVDAECAKGTFYQFDDEWNRVPVDSYTVQKNQECYYIVFNAEYNGVPVYNETLYYMTIKDVAIFHPTITAIYSANGLIELKVSEYRVAAEQGEKISQLISPESAAQAVGDKYKDVVGMEKIEFDKMSLMYVYTPYSENGKIVSYKTNMSPAWVCTIKKTEYTFDRKTGKQAPVTSQKDILIDAQTGAEII